MTPEQFSRVYALLGDRTRRPDGDEWDHDSLGRLVRDINAAHAGFTTPRATPEPLPLSQGPGSTEAARRAAIAAAAEAVRLAKGKGQG